MANTLYYGSGACSLQTTDDIIGVEIKYTGAIKITDKTEDNYQIFVGDNKMLIIPLGTPTPLSDLFDYVGEFKINAIFTVGADLKRISCGVKKVMDYSELLQSKSEDLTVKSEDINAGYLYKHKVTKTTVDDNIIKNLHSKGEFYKEDGAAYTGAYHIHKETLKVMTGGEHSSASEDLYIKKLKTGKLVLTGKTKKVRRSAPVTKTTRMGTSKAGGY